MIDSEIIIPVINSFCELKKELETLEKKICEDDNQLPIFFVKPEKLITSKSIQREQVSFFLSQLEYLDNQEPREILVGPGIVSCSLETIEQIKIVNEKKDYFKSHMLNLRAKKISAKELDKYITNVINERPDTLNEKLKKIGLARLHLKQCYRLLPFFTKPLKKISWTWANTRSIKKITTKQAYEMLLKNKRDKGIEHQIAKLKSIPQDEPLAIVQELAPHLRANIVFHDNSRIMVKGAVPIFCLSQNLPEFTPPRPKSGKDENRLIRNDVKLEPKPFLPAIRAHRYQSELSEN